MRGTIAVAAIHAVVIGFSLWILGVPLLIPLTILVFVAAFIPLVGILVAGTVAVLVTLGTKGWIAAVILIVIFILENQLESHLLQPLVVGRMVRLHPLADHPGAGRRRRGGGHPRRDRRRAHGRRADPRGAVPRGSGTAVGSA